MFHIRVALSTIALAGLIGTGAALAQTPAAPSAPNVQPTISTPAAEPSNAAEVEKWTIEQWDAAKAEWAEEQTKWANCQRLVTDQNQALNRCAMGSWWVRQV